MSQLSTARHETIINPREHNPQITIIGVGATGSRLFAMLIELGMMNITVVDFDFVEPHNLSNQLYNFNDIGAPKVEGLRNWYAQKIGIKPENVPETLKFINGRVPDANIPVKGIVFLMTDTMASRREILASSLRGNFDVYHVFETRMAATHGNVMNFNPINKVATDWWESTLISDDDAEVSPCGTSISVSPTANFVASTAVWQFIQYLTNPEALDKQVDFYLKPFLLISN